MNKLNVNINREINLYEDIISGAMILHEMADKPDPPVALVT